MLPIRTLLGRMRALGIEVDGVRDPRRRGSPKHDSLSDLDDIFDQCLQVIASLEAADVDYAIIGGVAMNLHGFVRGTEDLYLMVRPDPDNIRRLREALRAVWDDPDIDQITAEDLCGEYPAVRYGPPVGPLWMKRGTVRPIDQADAQALRDVFDIHEED